MTIDRRFRTPRPCRPLLRSLNIIAFSATLTTALTGCSSVTPQQLRDEFPVSAQISETGLREFDGARANDRFTSVEVTFRNNSDESAVIWADKITASTGEIAYSSTHQLSSQDQVGDSIPKDLKSKIEIYELDPRETVTRTIAFDVPVGTELDLTTIEYYTSTRTNPADSISYVAPEPAIIPLRQFITASIEFRRSSVDPASNHTARHA